MAAEARAAIAMRGCFALTVSGGHTPWMMLRALAEEDIPWAGVHVVQVDERVAPDGLPDRNPTHLRESLLQHASLRVVSMPSWQLFEQQDQGYRNHVLPPAVTARVAVEQASTFGWERYVGASGTTIGMTTFGASAPLKALQKEFRFTKEHI